MFKGHQIAGLQEKLFHSLHFLLNKEVLSKTKKVQKLMNLVDKPDFLSDPIFNDDDLYFWAPYALGEPTAEMDGLEILVALLQFDFCPEDSEMREVILAWRKARGELSHWPTCYAFRNVCLSDQVSSMPCFVKILITILGCSKFHCFVQKASCSQFCKQVACVCREELLSPRFIGDNTGQGASCCNTHADWHSSLLFCPFQNIALA